METKCKNTKVWASKSQSRLQWLHLVLIYRAMRKQYNEARVIMCGPELSYINKPEYKTTIWEPRRRCVRLSRPPASHCMIAPAFCGIEGRPTASDVDGGCLTRTQRGFSDRLRLFRFTARSFFYTRRRKRQAQHYRDRRCHLDNRFISLATFHLLSHRAKWIGRPKTWRSNSLKKASGGGGGEMELYFKRNAEEGVSEPRQGKQRIIRLLFAGRPADPSLKVTFRYKKKKLKKVVAGKI